MRGGRMRVAPRTLKRLLQEPALPACGEEQRVDCGNQETHAKRLVAAVAQPHIHAERISARNGLKRLREVAKHHEACGVDACARLGEAQLHGGKFTMRRLPPPPAPRGGRMPPLARKTAGAPPPQPNTRDTTAVGRPAREECQNRGL